ncbi:arginine--tRNA ligase [Oleiphilus sp. HI0009]|nr:MULTISPECIES: arginine--tRNA ligase [unclassified Oleiphilus]KZX84220.1 arginine--tRNA ligase [Oleiphilus sp. HI0009]KZY67910.1 arginine--tRNA ligase [Oleiphilus sp. HI0066]KZY70296.1 arginine--tRNA ligase [Oleiphilus sp. HI0067]
MKDVIAQLIESAIQELQQDNTLPGDLKFRVMVDTTKDKSHGDFATNIALMLAKQAGTAPRALAENICAKIENSNNAQIEKLEIAGPGFINFFVSSASQFAVLEDIFARGENFGRADANSKPSIQVEFVSANPTGPLHVGHGRGAAYGATVSDFLEAAGYQVQREYYVNDAGRQMNILAASVWLRYLELLGQDIKFPVNGYKGEYIFDIAKDLQSKHGDAFSQNAEDVYKDLPKDEDEGGDKELYIDAVIVRARELLGDGFKTVYDLGADSIVDEIREDLGEFGVNYQRWFSEASLKDSIEVALAKLQENGFLYEKNGATWFRSTDFGDDKDRVVKRDNGETTYFASDIAYHYDKFERGFERVINVWGADHHGYITRVKASLQALGIDPEKLTVKLVQFAILYRGGERVQMSTRSGSFVTLRELREEVGNDAARFFYVTRKAEQHMDFDLDLAKSQSKDNPVYYIQYAHARIASMLRKLEEEGALVDQANGLSQLTSNAIEAETELAKRLAQYPQTLINSAEQFEPHTMTHYLRDLASEFHTYYNANKMLVEDHNVRDARITLSLAVQQVLSNGLNLLGVSAPDSM